MFGEVYFIPKKRLLYLSYGKESFTITKAKSAEVVAEQAANGNNSPYFSEVVFE